MPLTKEAQKWSRLPLLLTAGQFTPLTRTPWAGSAIARKFKDEIMPEMKDARIGESWEFSCDPDFPSRIAGTTITILDLIKHQPTEVLSPELVSKSGANCEILVKLLSASQPLSLQVHPADRDASLAEGECGKPESWLILDAEPGAGLYLGFSRAIDKDELRRALVDGESCRDLLQFVPVKVGDFFDLAAGVPHAIGPGVTLLEPQRILFGKSGKTYRLWDWGRRYDNRGYIDMIGGKPRQLHIEEGLRLIDPMKQVGREFVDSIRRSPELSALASGGKCAHYPSNGYYVVDLLQLNEGDAATVDIRHGYGVLVPLKGHLTAANSAAYDIDIIKGQPVMLPHSALPVTLSARKESRFAMITPAGAVVTYR